MIKREGYLILTSHSFVSTFPRATSPTFEITIPLTFPLYSAKRKLHERTVVVSVTTWFGFFVDVVYGVVCGVVVEGCFLHARTHARFFTPSFFCFSLLFSFFTTLQSFFFQTPRLLLRVAIKKGLFFLFFSLLSSSCPTWLRKKYITVPD